MVEQQEFVHPEFLVETHWLAEHLGNKELCVVDCDVPEQYQRAHVPGSVFMADHYQKAPDTDRVHIMAPDVFSQMAESLGIGDDTLVISYDNSRGLYAARLWWSLNYYGHTNVKVLNGGWRKWLSEDRPVTSLPTRVSADAKFTPRINPSLMVTADQIKDDYQKQGVVIWDVRSRGEYVGNSSRGNRRPGHIPNAVHLEWLDLIDDGTHLLKSPSEIKHILESHGITPDKRIEVH